jgi:predicted O-methyltransferase YrrM
MMSIVEAYYAGLRLLRYTLTARHRNGHGVHSPAVFEFVEKVVCDKTEYTDYQILAEMRNGLRSNMEIIYVEDLGVRSHHFRKGGRTISRLNRLSSIREKYGKLLYRIVRYYALNNIVELGTSLGVSAAYMAMGNRRADILSIEGNKALCDFAAAWHKSFSAGNIRVRHMLFSEALAWPGKEFQSPDLVFLDGDHTYASTLKNFMFFRDRIQHGFIILDDINWSGGMRKAWMEIVNAGRDYVTIDLYQLGIVMFRDSLTPGNYVVRFKG